MLPDFNNIVLRRNDLPGSVGAARFPLSVGAANGNQPIDVPVKSGGLAFDGGGTVVHTFPTTTNGFEEVYLYASNYSSSDVVVTLSFGTGDVTATPPTISATSRINVQVDKNSGLSLIYPGVAHRSVNIESPLTLWACAATANSISLFGYVIRYYPISPNENLVNTAGYSAL